MNISSAQYCIPTTHTNDLFSRDSQHVNLSHNR